MNAELSQSEKNSLLKQMLQHLAARGVVNKWALSQQPQSDIETECQELMGNQDFVNDITAYLDANPIIQQTVETLLAHMAMAAGTRWQNVAPVLQPLARRGWYLGRWLPTFLIVDGPLGRVIRNSDSPLNKILRQEYSRYPILTQVRDILNTDLFRWVRNGVGHWSFLWNDDDPANPSIVMVDWQTGKPLTTISLLEGEALHLVVFSVVDTFDHEIFSRINPR